MGKMHAPTLSGEVRPCRRYSVWEYAILGTVLLYAAALVLIPMGAMVFGALRDGMNAVWEQIAQPDALNALKLTCLLAVGATCINAVVGVTIAWVLVRDGFRGRRLLNGLVDLPFAVSPVVAGLMLILLFGRGGWFTGLIDALGLKIVFAWPGMLLATLFVSLPFVIREVMPVLSQLGSAQEEAAFTLGAGRWQAFWRVTFPSLRMGLLYGISLTMARSLGEFGAVLVVSGGVSGLTETATLFIFRSLDDRNYVGAYSMALVLAALSFSLLMAMEAIKRHGKRAKL